MAEDRAPALSLILCARNDEYMGDSVWRLQTALCHAARELVRLGRSHQAEILVADWGSDVPLSETVRLTPEAKAIVSFLFIPRDTAVALQKDSPFAEVLALNAAARRSRGDFIGRVDQDTLVGRRFLQTFFELYDETRSLEARLEKSLLFSNLRMVPYRLAVACPPTRVVDWIVERYGKHFAPAEPVPPIPFYAGAVGICMMHRSLWFECGGYDERMIYMNAMETNLARRLLLKYEAVNLGAMVCQDFYHLEHYHPRTVRRTSTHRKVNAHLPFSQPDTLNPNGEEWGLTQFTFEISRSSARVFATSERSMLREFLAFGPNLVSIMAKMLGDYVYLGGKKWTNRAVKVRHAVRGKPLQRWPSELRARWVARSRA